MTIKLFVLFPALHRFYKVFQGKNQIIRRKKSCRGQTGPPGVAQPMAHRGYGEVACPLKFFPPICSHKRKGFRGLFIPKFALLHAPAPFLISILTFLDFHPVSYFPFRVRANVIFHHIYPMVFSQPVPLIQKGEQEHHTL